MTSLPTLTRSSATVDPAAPIAALFDEHCDFVCRVLRHHGVHDSALDDAVQDVFVTAYRRWSSFEGRSSARSWLYGIARRIAFRYRRSADSRARRETTDAAPPDGVDEPFARVQAAQSLATLLGRIDRDKRAVFVLIELEGMTAPEVADALGIPVGTTYSRLRAAWQGLGREADRERERLRRQLHAMQPPGPSDARRRRLWGLVAGGLGPQPVVPIVAAGMGGWSAGQWLVMGAALGAALWGAHAVIGSHAAPARTPAAEISGPSSSSRVETIASAPPSPDAPAPPEPSTAPSADAPPSPTKANRPPEPRRPAAPTRDAHAEPSDPLTAELSIVQRARQATREGRGRAALELLDEHARRYPRGQLANERRLARLDALCGLGRHAEAAELARALGRDPRRACPAP